MVGGSKYKIINNKKRFKKNKSKSKQSNVSFIHEMVIINEILVSLLAEKNKLINFFVSTKFLLNITT